MLEPDTQIVPPRTGPEDAPIPRREGAARAGSDARDEPVLLRRWVGRYELIHRLARGGMATVYLGRAKGKAGFEKVVAVKLIHPHLADEAEFVGMFLDEARIAARIHHPHVVEILDLGESDGAYFMVMEFIEGENLSALVRALGSTGKGEAEGGGERLPVAVALQIVADTLEGLSAAHELRDAEGRPYKLVHRDVSPHNILINLDGWAKVGDFGIMKAAGKASSTKTGELRGKLAYMSPEQARGEGVDHRTDLFAVGVILWELLTGERLFACASEAATLEKVMACEVPPLTRSRGFEVDDPELHEGLQRLLDRVLAPTPEDRPSDAASMLVELKRLLRLVEELDSQDGDCEEPRAHLGRLMRRFFARRVDYARAALRRTGEHDALGSSGPAEHRGREWVVEPTVQVRRSPSGSHESLEPSDRTDGAAGAALSSSEPGSGAGPLQTGSNPSLGSGVGAAVDGGPLGTASHPQLSMVRPSPLAQWIMWLLLPMLGAGIAIAAMLVFGPQWAGRGTGQGDAGPEPDSLVEAPEPRELERPESTSFAATEYQPVPRKQSPPGQVRWYFSTNPRGARVLIDGELRGDPTPTWVHLPIGEEPLDIRLELDGYEPRTLQLPAVHDQTFSETLEPLTAESSAAKPKPHGKAKPSSKPKQVSKAASGKDRTKADEGPGKTGFAPVPESLLDGKPGD